MICQALTHCIWLSNTYFGIEEAGREDDLARLYSLAFAVRDLWPLPKIWFSGDLYDIIVF
jgi:hypothetical protein